MARYSASGSQTLTTSAVTPLGLAAQSTAPRSMVYEMWFGNIGAPADLVTVHTVQRTTTDGSGTGVTPTAIDMADRASQCTVLENHTSEPTYTSNTQVLEIPLNHRATFRWVAAPGGEIVTPATDNNGIGFTALHASATTDWRGGAMWEE